MTYMKIIAKFTSYRPEKYIFTFLDCEKVSISEGIRPLTSCFNIASIKSLNLIND